MMSGVCNDGASMVVSPRMSESGSVSGPVGFEWARTGIDGKKRGWVCGCGTHQGCRGHVAVSVTLP